MNNNKPNDVRAVPVELLEITTSFIESHAEAFAKLNHGKRSDAFDKLSAELRAILAQPADQQGEPVACTSCDGSGEYIDALGDWRGYCCCPPGIELKARHAQPATAKVVLPERMREATEDSDIMIDCQNEGWNACLDEVAKLNTPQ
ncbi:hypothetical protein [Pseudomonas viridiflava]|uniref:hypothetical protein n=1 Tax=Pseudomonas viridiflava TaxID=33069 RepID=UPI000F09009F|nr:hypothetical protein [Pseudomonas viridiflava]